MVHNDVGFSHTLMTIKDFDNYRFSIKTEIRFDGEWSPVTEVNFESRWVGIDRGQIYLYKEIEDIREK